MSMLLWLGLLLLGLFVVYVVRRAQTTWRALDADEPDPLTPEEAYFTIPEPRDFLYSTVQGDFRLDRTAAGFCASWKEFMVGYAPDGRELWRHEGLGWGTTVAPDGRTLLTATTEQTTLVRLDAATGAVLQRAPLPVADAYASYLRWLPGGQVVLSADDALWVLDAATLQPTVQRAFTHDDVRTHVLASGYAREYADATADQDPADALYYWGSFFGDVAPHPTDANLAVVLDSNFNHLLHLRLDTLEIVALAPTEQPDQLRPSPDHRLLVLTLHEGRVVLTDAATLQPVRGLEYTGYQGVRAATQPADDAGYTLWARLADLSPNQQQVAVIDGSGQVLLLDAAGAVPARPVPRPVLDFAYDVRWLDDHTLLALLDGHRLTAVDTRTLQPRFTLPDTRYPALAPA